VPLVTFASGADSDQVLAPEDLGRPDFREIEGDALNLHQDIENRVRATAADCAAGAFVEAPRRVFVEMVGIRTVDMRSTVPPGDPERVENFYFAAFDSNADVGGRDKALGVGRWRAHSAASLVL